MNGFWEDAFLAPRRASSASKKGMFSSEEGPFLVPSLRPFWMERGVVSEISQHFCLSIECSLFYYQPSNRAYLSNLFCERNTSPPPQPSSCLERKSIPQRFTLCSVFIKTITNDGRNALCTLSVEGHLWARNVCKNAPWTLWALWEKKIPSTSPFAPFSGNTNSNPFESIVYTRKAVTSDEVTACVCLREKSLTSR